MATTYSPTIHSRNPLWTSGGLSKLNSQPLTRLHPSLNLQWRPCHTNRWSSAGSWSATRVTVVSNYHFCDTIRYYLWPWTWHGYTVHRNVIHGNRSFFLPYTIHKSSRQIGIKSLIYCHVEGHITMAPDLKVGIWGSVSPGTSHRIDFRKIAIAISKFSTPSIDDLWAHAQGSGSPIEIPEEFANRLRYRPCWHFVLPAHCSANMTNLP